MDYTPQQIAAALDYAVLNPLADVDAIQAGAKFCKEHGIKSFCVASANVRDAKPHFDNVCSVIGFPHGNASEEAKYQEAVAAVWDGAEELDVVINYGRFLGGDLPIIAGDLDRICDFARSSGVLVKAILESCYYDSVILDYACHQAIDAGVHFLKTSTGFGDGPATPEAVEIMLKVAEGTDVQVKASGGIKTYADAKQYLDMGCTRLGASRYRELLR
jgi:deoxyribose-phosphate aldolase